MNWTSAGQQPETRGEDSTGDARFVCPVSGRRARCGRRCDVRQFVPPVGLILVVLIPTVPLYEIAGFHDTIMVGCHCTAAFMMFLGAAVVESPRRARAHRLTGGTSSCSTSSMRATR